MRDEEKRKIILLAVADIPDDEGEDPPTTSRQRYYTPLEHRPMQSRPPRHSQSPSLADGPDDEGQDLPTTPRQYYDIPFKERLLQSKPPRQSQSPSVAHGPEDEEEDLPTTPRQCDYTPLEHRPPQSKPPRHLQSPLPAADDVPDERPLQSSPPRQSQPPLQVLQASIWQLLLSQIKSIKPAHWYAILTVLLAVLVFLSRPASTPHRPTAENVLGRQNHLLRAGDFKQSTSSQHLCQGKCCRLPLPERLSVKLPLPHPINASVHQSVLDQTGRNTDQQLLLLFEHKKLVSESLRDIIHSMQWANQHLISLLSKGNFDKPNISKAINYLETRLGIARTQIDKMAALYSSMEECYKAFDKASASALLTDQMTPSQEFAVKWQTRSLELLNVNFHEWYEVPWQQKVRRREDARIGLAVFDLEFRRVQQIKSLFDALQQVRKECAPRIYKIDKPNVAEKVWGQMWWCYKTSNIGDLWAELLDAAKEDEDGPNVELTTEWCRS